MQTALPLALPADESLPFADYTYPATWNGLVLVGEAPGAEEARLGRPFVGRSGQLLDKMLDRVGIDRGHCLIANVFRYQPPRNKVDQFFISQRAAQRDGVAITEQYGKFGSFYCRAAFATEIDHLAAMLKERQPRAVLALGRTPLWALTGQKGLMAHAGQILPCRLTPNVPVVVTFHPSFILRGNWSLQDDWATHFQKAINV